MYDTIEVAGHLRRESHAKRSRFGSDDVVTLRANMELLASFALAGPASDMYGVPCLSFVLLLDIRSGIHL
jgi:hypothetical protein